MRGFPHMPKSQDGQGFGTKNLGQFGTSNDRPGRGGGKPEDNRKYSGGIWASKISAQKWRWQARKIIGNISGNLGGKKISKK